MSDAHRDILKMLSDNVISVDEAERLLKALNEGAHGKKDDSSKAEHSRHYHGIGGVLESIGETLSEIGPMVKNTVEDVISGVIGDDLSDLNEDELDEVLPIDGKYAIAEGMHMLIVSMKTFHNQGDLTIQGVAGKYCRINAEHAKHIRVQRNASQFVIRWAEGPLSVEVPETVAKLTVRSQGGNICSQHIGCSMNLKTFGGNLDLENICQDVKAKTMGGDIRLALAEQWSGKGRVRTAGGHIALAIPDQVALQVEATTMGGTITLDEDMQPQESKQHFPGKNSVKVQLGEQQTDSHIALKTMGGNITLRKVHYGQEA